MSIAMFAVPGVLAPLHGFFRWLASGTAPTARAVPPVSPVRHDIAIKSIATHAHSTGTSTRTESNFRSCSKPVPAQRRAPMVRMVRVLEAGQASANVGRMVISGRMADVCAELDRLAAREAALH